jgi:hypothetical protein
MADEQTIFEAVGGPVFGSGGRRSDAETKFYERIAFDRGAQTASFVATLLLAVVWKQWIEPIALVVILLIVIPIVYVYQHRLRLRITADEIWVTRIGRDVRLDRNSIDNVVVLLSKESQVVDRVALLLRSDGTALGRLNRSQWGDETVDEAIRHLAVPVVQLDEMPLSLRDIKRRYPGSYSWARTHLALMTIFVLVPIVGVLAAVSVLTSQ